MLVSPALAGGNLLFYITDETNNPLEFAAVSLEGRYGGYTNADGVFLFSNIPKGEYEAKITIIGYRDTSITVEVLEGKTGRYSVALSSEVLKAEVAEKTPEWELFRQEVTIGQNRFSEDEFASLPAVEKVDPPRSVIRFPGATVRNDLFCQMNIRGLGAEYQKVVVGGASVYNPYHIGGVLSIFSGDNVRSLTLYKGALPPRFGGRIGSVLEITPKVGDYENFSGGADINLLFFGGGVSVPLKKGNIVISGRKSLLIDFYDLTARGRFGTSPTGRVDFFLLNSNDELTGDSTAYFKSGNLLIQGGFQTISLGKYLTRGSGYFSSFEMTVDDDSDTSHFNNSIEEGGGLIDITSFLGDHITDFGLTMAATKILYLGTASGDTNFDDTHNISSFRLFIQDKWYASEKFILQYGTGFTYFHPDGYSMFEPRIRGKFFINEELAVSSAFGISSQYIRSIADETSDFPFDVFFPSDKAEPAKSTNISVGIQKWLGKEYTLTGELFYSKFSNLSMYKDSLARWNDFFWIGEGDSYGLEALFGKTGARMTGHIGYTLLFSNRKFAGESFPSSIARRHTVTAVLSLSYGKWTLGTAGELASGNPYTPNGKERNSRETEPYFRLDISGSRAIGEKVVITPYLSIINITNHKNIFDYSADETAKKGLPLIPFVGIRGSF